MADDAAGRSAKLAVPGHMAGDTAHYGALDASFGLGGSGGDERNGESGGGQHGFHDGSPNLNLSDQPPRQPLRSTAYLDLDSGEERASAARRCLVSISILEEDDDGNGKA